MTYEELVEIAQHDDRIVGLVLTGSRGREFAVGDASDWDVRLVVRDDVLDEYRERFGTPHGSTVEVVVLSLSELEDVGVRGSDTAWDRYSYVAATLAVDDVGDSLSRVLDRLGSLDRNEARQLAAERLDDYVNAYYRAAKNAQAGLADEARLDARESVPLCLDFLFAVNERVRPFNRFLRWELDRRPLPGAAWSAAPDAARGRRCGGSPRAAPAVSRCRGASACPRARRRGRRVGARRRLAQRHVAVERRTHETAAAGLAPGSGGLSSGVPSIRRGGSCSAGSPAGRSSP